MNKTIEEIADAVIEKIEAEDKQGRKIFWNEWDGTSYSYEVVIKVAEEYAKQCCNEQIKACAENAEAERDQCYDGGGHCGFPIVDKDSILSTSNVAEKP